MMTLLELVDELVDTAHKLQAARPRVIVRVYLEGGAIEEREIELVSYDRKAGAVVLLVPRAAQPAGEPGAGDVVDESDVSELDVDLVLGFACGERGCGCADGRCMTDGKHPECRERLKREQQARIRLGERGG